MPSDIIRRLYPEVIFTQRLSPRERLDVTGPDGLPYTLVGVGEAPVAKPSTNDRRTEAIDSAEVSPTTADALLGTGPTLDQLAASFSKQKTVLAKMLGELGPVDRFGRPFEGRTLWWFAAACDPSGLLAGKRRAELQGWLSQLHEQPALRAVIAENVRVWLQEARDFVLDPKNITAMRNGGTPHDKQTFVAGSRVIVHLCDQAQETLDAWASDKTFCGDEYFMARHVTGAEMTNGAHAKNPFFTVDDVIVEKQADLEVRLNRYGNTLKISTALIDRIRAEIKEEAAPTYVHQKSEGTALAVGAIKLLSTHLARDISGELNEKLAARIDNAEYVSVRPPKGYAIAAAYRLNDEKKPELVFACDAFQRIIGVLVTRGKTVNYLPTTTLDEPIEQAKSYFESFATALIAQSKSGKLSQKKLVTALIKSTPTCEGVAGGDIIHFHGRELQRLLNGIPRFFISPDSSETTFAIADANDSLEFVKLRPWSWMQATGPMPKGWPAKGTYKVELKLEQHQREETDYGVFREGPRRHAGTDTIALTFDGVNEDGNIVGTVDGRRRVWDRAAEPGEELSFCTSSPKPQNPDAEYGDPRWLVLKKAGSGFVIENTTRIADAPTGKIRETVITGEAKLQRA